MIIQFDEKQKALLEKIGIELKDGYTDEEILQMDELVTEHFQLHGIDGDEVNETGLICESIIDKLRKLALAE